MKFKINTICSTVLCLATLCLSGCVGTQVSNDELASFVKGQDTQNTVQSKIGKPWKTEYTGNDYQDMRHLFDIYSYSVSTLLLKDIYYFEITLFTYDSNKVLTDATQITCYTQDSCQDALESEQYKIVKEDNEKILAYVKDKKAKKELAEQKKALAEKERQRQLRLQKEKDKPKVTAVSSVSTQKTNGKSATVVEEENPAETKPSSTDTNTPSTSSTPTRRNLSL